MQARLADESQRAEESDVHLQNELQAFEVQVNGRLMKQKHSRKEMSSTNLKEIDERNFQLTLELAKIKKNREENEVRYGTELKDLVAKIATQVDQERAIR